MYHKRYSIEILDNKHNINIVFSLLLRVSEIICSENMTFTLKTAYKLPLTVYGFKRRLVSNKTS